MALVIPLKIGTSCLVLLAACSTTYIVGSPLESRPRSVGCVPGDCGDLSQQIAVTYLGVSGILIEHQGHALLTAPFFTNPFSIGALYFECFGPQNGVSTQRCPFVSSQLVSEPQIPASAKSTVSLQISGVRSSGVR